MSARIVFVFMRVAHADSSGCSSCMNAVSGAAWIRNAFTALQLNAPPMSDS